MTRQLTCPVCAVVMEYSLRPPRFCSQCGNPLGTPTPDPGAADPTVAFVPDPSTRIDDESFPTPQQPALPVSIGGYRLLRALGSGGMGTVYEAEQEGTGRRVAVKLIRAEFVDSSEAVERFRREGRLASAISHPRCVFVLAAEEEKGRPYIVMELMPGRNLHDLIEQRGPLPVHEAVALILDIIEGLQEAHRCGLVHRDVKPSNCFLDATGRVKVGDFGLAKSLLTDQHLTHTGAFLGTLLYAAPEQIRMDPVDHRADIYSVGATLYYLLTGRAPFQTDDAAATLARTMSDPLPPMRDHRPDLPRTLDEIMARALARQPDQRYQTLEELRLALLPFAPGNHAIGTVGWRICALLLDGLILWPLDFIFMAVVLTFLGALIGRLSPLPAGLLAQFVGVGVGLLYFALMEANLGWTPGKWFFRLRVCDADSLDRPRLSQAALRTLVFYLFKDFGPVLMVFTVLAPLVQFLRAGGSIEPTTVLLYGALIVFLPVLTSIVGLLLLTVTMRLRNGYRGVHELASGTRTIRLPWRRERRALRVTTQVAPVRAETPLPGKMGAFLVRQALNWQGERGLLLAEDSGLGRQVWIWLHGDDADIATPVRREIGRTTRPRWVASGKQDGHAWDAFVAAPGCPLPTLIQPGTRLLWADFLPVLEQLSDELSAALEDGTLPRVLSLEQVWVEPSGRVQLLDAPLGPIPQQPSEDDPHRALKLLRDACRLALEGKLPAAGETASAHLAAPLPGHARGLMNRLFRPRDSYRHPAEVRRDLEGMKDQATEVGQPRRGVHLVLQAVLLAAGLSWMFLSVPLIVQGQFLSRMESGARGEVSLAQFRRIPQEDLSSLVARAQPDNPKELYDDLLTASATLRRQLGDPSGKEDSPPSEAERERRLVLASCSPWVRNLVHKLRLEITHKLQEAELDENGNPLPVSQIDLVTLSDQMQESARILTEPTPDHLSFVDTLELMAFIGFWPAVWGVWSLLTRGGLSRRVVGIALVQADGRPAARWRCLWRCVVLWVPIVLLLTLSACVDMYRIATYHGTPYTGWFLAWIAWGSWWLAVLLLPIYAWLARQTPARSLHDRLAGTYQVPA
jgi:uncharacterized RDD family membrane protein YckC